MNVLGFACILGLFFLGIFIGYNLRDTQEVSPQAIPKVESEPSNPDWSTERWRGHTWVIHSSVHGYQSGIAHDPDCPCKFFQYH